MGNLSKNSNWKRLHDDKSMQRNVDGDDNRAACINDIWSYSTGKFIEIVAELNRLSQICFTNKLLLNKA